jgi:cytochrome c peroxidase
MELIMSLILLALFACGDTAAPVPAPAPEKVVEAPPMEAAAPKHVAMFGVLPENMYKGDAPSAEMIDLGRQLYYETRMSKNHDLSCNSCHMLDKYGVDNKPTSSGHKGQLGGRNSPTAYNAALHIAQFWDGRAADVEAQAKGPVLNPIEMAMPSEEAVVGVLKSIPGYRDAFKAAFPGQEMPITYDNMAIAIGAFERGLVTKNSAFDKYLAGDVSALTEGQVAGLDLFVETGCTTCHMGATMGGQMYQKLGLVNPYESKDQGRKEVTGNDADALMFKVPSLRNIDMTGPYFHDGSIATLDEAVRLMAHHQLGKDLDAAQVASIVEFLKSATGEILVDYVKQPAPLPSGPKTPKADPS